MNKSMLVLILSIGCSLLVLGCNKEIPKKKMVKWSKDKAVIAKAIYPDSIGFDDRESKMAIRDKNVVEEDFINAVNNFTYDSTTQLLKGSDPLVNHMYSPMSLHTALSLTASGADGITQKEILKALKLSDFKIKDVGQQSGNLFRKLYVDNEIGKLHIANSLWLSVDGYFKKSFIESSIDNYYSSIFAVDFNDKRTGELMSAWISEQTNGTLERDSEVDSEQVMALINTIYFYDEWTNKFNEKNTKADVFKKHDGSKVKSDFMNSEYMSHGFIRGDGFVSSSLGFKNSANMTFYLPNDDISIYDLIDTPDKLSSMLNRDNPNNEHKMGEVIFKVPKFKFGTTLKLKDTLKTIGINDMFKPSANFNGIAENSGIYVSDVRQATHISINEKGCEASAYTEIIYCGSALPEDKAEMILDRPFLFTIKKNDVILFVGIVNDPTLD